MITRKVSPFNIHWIIACIVLIVSSCHYEDIPREPDPAICTGTNLSVSATAQNASGCGKPDGSIVATATGGTGNLSFSLDGGITKQSSGTFQNLAAGTFTITVYDGNLCSNTAQATVGINGSNFQASVKTVMPDTECLTNNGSVELQASGGTAPYSFKLGTQSNSTGIFSSLGPGNYTVTVSDAACSLNLDITIPSQGSTSYANTIAPILTAKCNFSNCHGNGAPQVNLTNYTDVKNNAAAIKSRTADGSMPKAPKPGGALTADEIKLIACWVDDGAKNN